jgi:hypothetical protein
VAAFVANFVSFFGVILVVARWKRSIRRWTAPPETLTGAKMRALRPSGPNRQALIEPELIMD